MDGDDSRQTSGASGGWQFKPGDDAKSNNTEPAFTQGDAPQAGLAAMNDPSAYEPTYMANEPSPQASVSWSASEFIAHEKSFGWYAVLALVAIAATALVFLLTKDKISTAVVIVAAIIFGVAAGRKPRTLVYKLDGAGLTAGSNFYDYGQFRSFAIVDEGPFASIVFMPLKRFMPLTIVYYDPRDEVQIVGILSAHLPLETHKLDLVERLMRKVRY